MRPTYTGNQDYTPRPELIQLIGKCVDMGTSPGLPNSLSRGQVLRVFVALGGEFNLDVAEASLYTIRELVYKQLGITGKSFDELNRDFPRSVLVKILDRLEKR